MSCARPSSLSRTNSALRSSSAIVSIRSFAALNSASSRSTFTSRSAAEHSTPPPALGYRAGAPRKHSPVLWLWFTRPYLGATLPVGLLRLDGSVLLVDEELARLVAPRQFLGVGHRLSLGLVDARRSAGSLSLYFPPSVGVCRHDVGLPLANSLGNP